MIVSATRPLISARWSNLVSNAPTPAVAERSSTMRSPISASGISARKRLPALPALARFEAEDLTAPRADQRAGARQRVGGHVDRHREDRLEQHRPRLRQRLAERDLGRGAERHVGGIDGVIGAVDQRHADVDHRKAERPAVHRVARAHLDRGEILPRHRAAVDVSRRRRSLRRARAAPPRPARRRTGRGRPTASCAARAP